MAIVSYTVSTIIKYCYYSCCTSISLDTRLVASLLTKFKMSTVTTELDFVVEPSEDFLCPICAKVFVEPHITECCGQHFCEQCLTKWFKELGSVICPHCRSINFAHIRYLPMKRKINDLRVYCSNKKDGCTSITTVSQLESHLSECSYTTVKCPLNCALSLLRKDVIGHCTNDCQNRISTCKYCKKRDKYYVITGLQHVMSCPDIPVGCPKNCPDGRSVKRKDLDTHRLNCPLESVHCSKCNAEMLRQQLSNHRLNKCPKRIIACLFCRTLMTFDSVNSHVNKCLEYPVVCPRQCRIGGSLKRKDLKEHASTCPLEPEVCKDCLVEIIRKDMANHRTNECPKRSITCRYCQMIGAFDHITGQHVNECEEFPTGCPRKCQGSEQMKRKNVKSHSEVCPLEPVECPFSEVGCKPQLLRRDLDSHMKSNLEQHMLKMMTSHTELVTKHKKMKDKHLKLQSDHSKLQMDHRRLKSELAKSQAIHAGMATRFSNMTSSISHELEFIEKAQVQSGEMNRTVSLQCIRTALNPILKDESDKIVLRVPQLQTTQPKTSSPFYVLDGYKMCFVYKKIDEPLARRDYWTSPRPSNSTKIDVSLHLMKGEKDDSLKWPINAPFTIHIYLKPISTDPWGRRTSQSNQYGYGAQSSYGCYYEHEEEPISCDEMKMAIALNRKSSINLDRVADEMSRKLECKSMISTGPLKAEITLI